MSAVGSILTIVSGGGKPLSERPYIIPLDQYNSDDRLDGELRYFQYWPEEITDNKQTNWETKNIPGLSHPLYQWVSGGAREISFVATFTRDRVLTDEEKNALQISNGTPIAFGAAFTALSIGSLNDPRNIDVPSAVSWLRAFLYPDYSTDGSGLKSSSGQRAKPPRKLILGLPGTRISHFNQATSVHVDEIVCIMTQCDVNYTSFFHDGSPRIAKVALQFVETIQYNSKVNAVDASALRAGGKFYGMTMTTRNKSK